MGSEYDTGIDLAALGEIREYFMKLRKKYLESGLMDQSMLATNTKALLYQVPGGMLSNLLKQLKDAGKADQLDEVLAEVPRVRKDSGFPPLVTPTSQIVGTQAVFNIIMGERYKTVTKEFKGMVKGEYGKTPVDIDPEFRKKILGTEEPITCRPAALTMSKKSVWTPFTRIKLIKFTRFDKFFSALYEAEIFIYETSFVYVYKRIKQNLSFCTMKSYKSVTFHFFDSLKTEVK